MSLIQAIILGIVQGLAEFLPISSSGHIELGKALLGVDMADDLIFSVFVHGATALSTIVVFRKDIWDILRDLITLKMTDNTRLALYILLSMVPVGLVYVLFKDQIESLFDGQILFVGCMLLVTAGLLYLSERIAPKQGTKVDAKRAWWIGVAQAIAILPGISRSGATISTALMMGIDRAKAARFSFLMVLPPILGATLLEAIDLKDVDMASEGISTAALMSGSLAAFLTGVLACTWMIRIVKSSKLSYFAIYCLIVGLLAIGTHFM